MPEFAVLVEGYHRFKSDAYVRQKARYDELANDGQAPPIPARRLALGRRIMARSVWRPPRWKMTCARR